MAGSWRIETAHEASAERFVSEGAAIARAWDITTPGGIRPDVFFDFSAAPTPAAVVPGHPRIFGAVPHVGQLPKPSLDQVGDIYIVTGTMTAYACVAKDHVRFATWEKVRTWLDADNAPHVDDDDLERIKPWLVKPADSDNDPDKDEENNP